MDVTGRLFLGLSLAASQAASLPAQTQLFGELRGMVPPGLDAAREVALGDVDGDGDLDVFVANIDGERLFVNDGSGVFTGATNPLPPPVGPFAYTTSLALGDVDGDGDLDALLGNSSYPAAQPNRLLRNNGAGVFTDASAQLPANVDFTQAVALGDVDGDGDLDAFIGNSDYPSGVLDRLYLNDGTGLFLDASAQLPAIADRTTDVALGDVDGDGDLDGLIGNDYDPNRLYLNDGTGTFTDATGQIPGMVWYTRVVAFGDLEGDGDLDAWIGTNGQDRLFLNDGSGAFVDATAQIPVLSDASRALALGDAEGDGDLDVFLGGGMQNRLYLNDGTASFSDASAQLPSLLYGSEAIALGDVDADGDVDAFLGNDQLYDGARNRLFLNDGSGHFVDASNPYPLLFDWTNAASLGDLDGDGDLDALLGNRLGASGQNRLYMNDGTGLFSDATAQLPPFFDDTLAVALGDFDSDGDVDALIGNTGQDRLFLNDGSGTFLDATPQLPPFVGATNAVTVGDVDGDGDLDALMGIGGGRLYLNDGAAGFTDASAQLPFPTGSTTAIALGDVDGDGDTDALMGSGGAGFSPDLDRLYLNDGTGSFLDATSQLPAIVDSTRALALGDLDGDGDLDALIGNHLDPDRLYLNDGTGFFSDTTGQLPVNLDATTSVALGDVDEDGDLDAFMGNGSNPYYGEPDRLYLNDGSGSFADATTLLPAITDVTRAVALGDLDGDGDLDAYIGKFQHQDRVYSNLARQLAWRGIPRIGKPLRMDLRGPSWGTWFLAFSLGSANLSIPPFGVLRLDPANLNLAASGLLDSQGRAFISFSVPSNPALIGATAVWQALVTSPARFTNLEITTLTNL